MTKLLDANQEPVFADLVTDPRFADIANEFLAPRSYEARHYSGNLNFMHNPEDCTACTPHMIKFMAKDRKIGRRRAAQESTIEGVVTEDSPSAKRATAREFGPRPKRTGRHH